MFACLLLLSPRGVLYPRPDKLQIMYITALLRAVNLSLLAVNNTMLRRGGLIASYKLYRQDIKLLLLI